MSPLRRLSTTLCALGALSLLHAPAALALPLDTIFATGVDDAGAPLADGATDTHWQVSSDDGQTFQAALNEKNNYCGSCGGVWVEWPQGDASTSRGITHPDFVRTTAPGEVFIWRQSFDVPMNADPASITVSYRVGFDDVSRNATDDANLTGCNHTVWLNGTAYAMTATGNIHMTECQATIPAGSAFVTGQNTIEFRIANLATYYGFRLEGVSAEYEIATVCGDGIVEGDESCDDGNTTSGDGCSELCEVEDGFGCVEPEFVFNGDFELGDTGTGGILPLDPSPSQSTCGGQDVIPRDGYYHVTSLPYPTCECDGGQGLCLATNGGGGVVWSQTITGLTPNTTYTFSARHALKGEASATDEPRLEVSIDGMQVANVSPTQATLPIAFDTISTTFTTGANQTTALIEFVNPVAVNAGNDMVIDSISVTGPSVCSPPCGDGVLDMGELCDDGNEVSGDGCSVTCEIEDGWSCEDEPSVCELLCGNGVLDMGEECDDGNAMSGDGCSATCLDEYVSLPLYSTGVDDSGVPIADGATDTHWEVSVDGGAFVAALNEKNNYCGSCGGVWLEWPQGDASTSRGITHPDHVRAAAPNKLFAWRQHFILPAGARPDTATVTYRVGFDNASRNATDDADLTGCDHTVWLNGTAYAMTATGNPYRTECEATIPAGSAFVAGQNTIEFRITNYTTYYGFRLDKIEGTFLLSCGDGQVLESEACDDGNTEDGDGCSATCEVEDGYTCDGEPSMCEVVAEPMCGDGVVDMNETCDDGNTDEGDGCSATCAVEDGYMCAGEPSTCEPVTVDAKCGDGMIAAGEGCDDGNTDDGDGCSATCVVEEGYMCSGSPSQCDLDDMSAPVCGDGQVDAGEECDDGNTDAGDGCSADCKKEEQEEEEEEEEMMSGDTDSDVEGGGCSCSTSSRAPSDSTPWMLGLLLGLGALVRRRRRVTRA